MDTQSQPVFYSLRNFPGLSPRSLGFNSAQPNQFASRKELGPKEAKTAFLSIALCTATFPTFPLTFASCKPEPQAQIPSMHDPPIQCSSRLQAAPTKPARTDGDSGMMEFESLLARTRSIWTSFMDPIPGCPTVIMVSDSLTGCDWVKEAQAAVQVSENPGS